jgi:hypothetical protein
MQLVAIFIISHFLTISVVGHFSIWLLPWNPIENNYTLDSTLVLSDQSFFRNSQKNDSQQKGKHIGGILVYKVQV